MPLGVVGGQRQHEWKLSNEYEQALDGKKIWKEYDAKENSNSQQIDSAGLPSPARMKIYILQP